jgi:hypothetical protein
MGSRPRTEFEYRWHGAPVVWVESELTMVHAVPEALANVTPLRDVHAICGSFMRGEVSLRDRCWGMPVEPWTIMCCGRCERMVRRRKRC